MHKYNLDSSLYCSCLFAAVLPFIYYIEFRTQQNLKHLKEFDAFPLLFKRNFFPLSLVFHFNFSYLFPSNFRAFFPHPSIVELVSL